MFLTIKKKVLISILCVAVCFVAVGVFFGVRATMAKPNLAPTIVIDAGHGGKDGGAVGDMTTESELNLKYSLALKKICQEFGYNVVLTRSDMNGLYNPLASNKKKSEMEKRRQIIEDSNPDVVVSIHMNSYTSSSARGSHVFYAEGSESGQALAQSVSNVLSQNIEYAHKTAKVGDYYILNCTSNPSILVECGFLSNPEEEALLANEDYINKFCYYIFCGILLYFDF
ncbi:MAG: N-acetylmuramoyl-L-alanine amidase [Candidatus Caccovivens sp.]